MTSSSSTKKRRIIYNDDGGSIIYIPHPYPMTLDQYYDCVDHLLGTHVDTYVLCIGATTHREAGGEVQKPGIGSGGGPWRSAQNWRHLESLGIHPPTALLDRAKDKGLEAIASIRMNDAHFAYSPEGPEAPGQGSRFWLDHRECRIDLDVDTSRVLRSTPEWPRVLYDYSHPMVQQLFLDTIDDTFEKCDADGLELDFLRHPYFFKPEEAPDKLDVMTDVLKRARQRLDEIGGEKGRSLEMGALVPVGPDSAREKGLDVLTWIKEGLLDYVVPKHYIQFLMDVPMKEYVAAARSTGTQVYACLENWLEADAGDPVESFRGAAAGYFEMGVDGIYVYNYFNHRPHPHSEADRRILQEIGDPQLIRRMDKRFALTSVEPQESYQLPLELSGDHSVHFTLGDDARSASEEWSIKSVVLRLEFNDLVMEEDRVEFVLNGAALPRDMSKAKFDDATYRYRWIEYDLTQGPLPRIGDNELVVRLKNRCPDIAAPLILTQVEVFTHYR